jgi:hypothetical protein
LTHLEKEAAGAVPGDLTAARPEDVDRVNLRPTMLDDPCGFVPFIEVYSGKIAL